MARLELEQIGYDAGMRDGINYVIKILNDSLDNPALDILTPRQVLGILIASLKEENE